MAESCKQCEHPSDDMTGLCVSCLGAEIGTGRCGMSRDRLETIADSLQGHVAGMKKSNLSASLVGELLSLARAAFKYQHENRQLNRLLDEAIKRAVAAEQRAEALAQDLARISHELGLPPGIGLAEGEFARMQRDGKRAVGLRAALQKISGEAEMADTYAWVPIALSMRLLAEQAIAADDAAAEGGEG